MTLGLYLVICHLAFSAHLPTAFAAVPDEGMNVIVNGLLETIGMINTFMHILLLILLNMLGYLLQADFFNDVTMMSALNNIWVLSRNIMNVIFALMLIFVALYTIFTANSEMIKSKIQNFILAVILVNFSWFFPRIIIDVANVLTATIYTIPNTWGFDCRRFDNTPCRVITDIKIFPTEAEVTAWPSSPGCSVGRCPCPGKVTCWKEEDYNSVSGTMGAAHAMINGMAVSFINIQAMTQLPDNINLEANTGTVATFLSTIKVMMLIMMTFFIQVAVTLPLLGLGVGLFIRILILWVTTAFMPFTFLGLVITGKLGTNVFGFEIDIWQEFINAAFLPAVVGIPFVIGFIMLSAVSTIPVPSSFPQTWGIPLLTGFPNWWTFMWMLAAVGIIWVGAFSALSKSRLTGKITDRIKNFGETIFRTGLQLPLITPLPIGIKGTDGKQVTLGQALNAPRAFSNDVNRRALGLKTLTKEERDRERERGGGLGSEIDTERMELLQRENTNRVVAAIDTLARNNSTNVERREALRDIRVNVGGDGGTGTDTLQKLKRSLENNPRIAPALQEKLAAIQTAIEEGRNAI